MEVLLHYVYVQAIAKAHPDWDSYTAPQLSLLAYFNLHFIWLKLLLPWRLFRLWALLDGVDPPENSARFLACNTTRSPSCNSSVSSNCSAASKPKGWRPDSGFRES